MTFGTCAATEILTASADATLRTGWHAIRLDYLAAGRGNRLQLAWTTPNGQKSLIPPNVFRFAPDTTQGGTPPLLPLSTWECTAP